MLADDGRFGMAGGEQDFEGRVDQTSGVSQLPAVHTVHAAEKSNIGNQQIKFGRGLQAPHSARRPRHPPPG